MVVPLTHAQSVTYTQVSAGRDFSVLLKSNGTAVAFGNNEFGQLQQPAVEHGQWITQVSAGHRRTMYLLNIGGAVAFGHNTFRVGSYYAQVSAGGCHCLLLRRDGRPETKGAVRFWSEPELNNLE